MKELIGIVVPFFSIITGVYIAFTKKLPQKYGADADIGNIAYFISLIFIIFGLYVFLKYLKED